MDTKLTILVVGATGQQGGAVARALLERGHHVRALTRSFKSGLARDLSLLGADLVKGDLSDKGSILRAAEGVDGIFGVTTPYEAGVESEVTQGFNLVDAAREAGVRHLVFSSVGSAHRNTGIPHFDSKYKVERHLAESGVPHTILGPVFFMENWLGPWFLPALQEGNAALAMPGNRKLAHISVRDIGRFTALIFERREAFLKRRYDIASDELCGEEVAEKIGAKAGKAISYYEIPLKTMREQNEDFARMFEWFDRVGYQVDIEALKRDYPEVGWTTFDEWIKRQDWSILDAHAKAS
jgi:uncharacterized protein YbjT (DUF2867 family)